MRASNWPLTPCGWSFRLREPADTPLRRNKFINELQTRAERLLRLRVLYGSAAT